MSTFFSSLLTLSVSLFVLLFVLRHSFIPQLSSPFFLLSSPLSLRLPLLSSLSLLPRVSSSSSSLPLRHKSGNVWYKFVVELLRFPA